MVRRLTIGLLFLLLPLVAGAAASVRMLTPLYTSVLGNEQRDYTVQFFDALGHPAVGERVRFSNDACGFFQNGQLAVDVFTDSVGRATATFSARSLGVGCWISVSAGVSARFNVFTYNLGQAYIGGGPYPAAPGVGQPFTLIAGAYQGAYPIYEADVTARVIPGTIGATIRPGGGNMGQSPRGIDFEVTPEDRVGDFEVEVAFRGIVTKRFAFNAGATPYQDLWWAGAVENGWGLSVLQHRDLLFSMIYAYDADGAPIWYVIPSGSWNEAHTAFTGAVYLPTGTPYSAYDASKLVMHDPVGTATITFNGASRAILDYTIAGVTARKNISRLGFGPVEAGAPRTDLGDLWWGGAAQNGWGISVLQQYKSLFALWFTYDAQGKATWFVMPAGTWTTLKTYEGRLYRPVGPAWLGVSYDESKHRTIDVGTFRFRFRFEEDRATFEYVIGGVAGSQPLERLGF